MSMCFSYSKACPQANITDSFSLRYIISLPNGAPLQHSCAGECFNILMPNIYKKIGMLQVTREPSHSYGKSIVGQTNFGYKVRICWEGMDVSCVWST